MPAKSFGVGFGPRDRMLCAPRRVHHSSPRIRPGDATDVFTQRVEPRKRRGGGHGLFARGLSRNGGRSPRRQRFAKAPTFDGRGLKILFLLRFEFPPFFLIFTRGFEFEFFGYRYS